MTVTAARAAAPKSGGTTSTGTEKLIRTAHGLLDTYGVALGARRVNRLVRQYLDSPAVGRCTFVEFFLTAIEASVETSKRDAAQRHIARERAGLDDPELALNPLTYADPVGHDATRAVDAERGWRA